MSVPDVRLGVLGPTQVVVSGRPLPLGGRKQTLVLALLLVECGHVVPTERLMDAVWGEDAAERAPGTLQVYVSNLRKALEPARAALGLPEVIATRRPGYAVDLGPAHVDVLAFTTTVRGARAALRAGDAARAAEGYRQALGLWRGRALGEFSDSPVLDAVRARLDAERHEVLLERFDAELEAGQHAAVLGELRAAVAQDPLDERLTGQLMLALYRCGRQAEALAAFQTARERLVDELGIEPGRDLRALEAKVLRHDAALDRGAGDRSEAGGETVLRSATLAPVALVVDGQPVPLVRTVTTIGRRRDRDIVLEGEDVSRKHAELRRTDGDLVIVDVGSANGVRVNGARVASSPLRPGDEVRIGRHVVRVEAGPGAGGSR